MSKLSRRFNEHSQKLLQDAIERLPGLSESLKKSGINLLKQNEVHIFGYGSLITKPHDKKTLTSTTTAYLWDYSRDMCCKSVASGTHKKTGLTLGLDKKEGAIVPGAILSYKNLTTNELTNMLEKFADREVITSLEIYKFKMLEVEKEDGTKVQAITCIADPEQIMGYAGDMITKFEEENLPPIALKELSLRKKANEIAWANGTIKKSGNHATGKSYFDRFIRIPIENKQIAKKPKQSEKIEFALYKEQQRMLKLANYIDEERHSMRQIVPEYVLALEKKEAEQLANWKNNKTNNNSQKPPTPNKR